MRQEKGQSQQKDGRHRWKAIEGIISILFGLGLITLITYLAIPWLFQRPLRLITVTAIFLIAITIVSIFGIIIIIAGLAIYDQVIT